MTQAEDGWGKARNGGLGIVFCCKAHQALEKAWREGKDFGVEAGSAALTVSTWTRAHLAVAASFCSGYQQWGKANGIESLGIWIQVLAPPFTS